MVQSSILHCKSQHRLWNRELCLVRTITFALDSLALRCLFTAHNFEILKAQQTCIIKLLLQLSVVFVLMELPMLCMTFRQTTLHWGQLIELTIHLCLLVCLLFLASAMSLILSVVIWTRSDLKFLLTTKSKYVRMKRAWAETDWPDRDRQTDSVKGGHQ
jgi:hypothetical protein